MKEATDIQASGNKHDSHPLINLHYDVSSEKPILSRLASDHPGHNVLKHPQITESIANNLWRIRSSFPFGILNVMPLNLNTWARRIFLHSFYVVLKLFCLKSAKSLCCVFPTGQIFLPTYEVPVLFLAGSVRGELDSVCRVLVLHRAVSWAWMQKFNSEYFSYHIHQPIQTLSYMSYILCVCIPLPFVPFTNICISQCDKYRKGVIDGSACSSLCEKDTLYLGKCFTAKPNSQVSLFLKSNITLQVCLLLIQLHLGPTLLILGVFWELGRPGGSH